MDLSYDVKIWNLERRVGKTRTTYRVVWFVASTRFPRTFQNRALADSFRSDLVAAARRGEAFDREQGLPVSMLRNEAEMPWFDFACQYVDMKWPRAAGKSRAGNADALASVTPAMLKTNRGAPDAKVLRRALTGWAFNTKQRNNAKPREVEQALRWLRANTLPVSRLNDVAMLRVVINPQQATKLLVAVKSQKIEGQPRRSSGPMLVAFFAVMYYAALRPEEAAMLRKQDLQLPEKGWGELLP